MLRLSKVALIAVIGLITALVSATSAQTRFSFKQNPAALAPADGWILVPLNGKPDDFTDIAVFHHSNTTLWLCPNNQGVIHCNGNPANVFVPGEHLIVALDRTQDGRDDVILFKENYNFLDDTFLLWEFADNIGTTFDSGSASGDPAYYKDGWTMYAGDFDGNGPDEVVGYQSSTGELVHFPANKPTPRSTWAVLSPSGGWQFVEGDFDMDGRLDLMGYNKDTGRFRLCRSTGSQFNCSQDWGSKPKGTKRGWQFTSGHFHFGSSREDIVGFRKKDKALWVGRNTGSKFVFRKWKTMSDRKWYFIAGYFSRATDHSAPENLLGYHRTDGSLWIGRPKE